MILKITVRKNSQTCVLTSKVIGKILKIKLKCKRIISYLNCLRKYPTNTYTYTYTQYTTFFDRKRISIRHEIFMYWATRM